MPTIVPSLPTIGSGVRSPPPPRDLPVSDDEEEERRLGRCRVLATDGEELELVVVVADEVSSPSELNPPTLAGPESTDDEEEGWRLNCR
jgi:hypothetical protein